MNAHPRRPEVALVEALGRTADLIARARAAVHQLPPSLRVVVPVLLAGSVAAAAAAALRSRAVGSRRGPRSPLDLDRVSTVIIDVDGTLIDSNAAHAEAWALAMTEQGMSRTAADVRPLVGMGGDKLIPAVTGVAADSAAGKAIAERKRRIFAERLPQLAATPGAADLLAHLRDAGKDVVVASSADDDEVEELLVQAGVEHLIPKRASNPDSAPSKPDPDVVRAALRRAGASPATAVMVGDTPYDVEAARHAGVETIAVRSGGHWSDIALAGAAAIVDDPAALLARWRR